MNTNTFLIVAGVLAVVCIFLYNSIIAKRNNVKNAFASIDAMLKKRFDLIPNLVATAQQSAKFEQSTLDMIVRLRSEGTAALGSGSKKAAEIDREMSKALKGFMIQVENYPDLKSNQNFLQLQHALQEIEDQLAATRRTYNATVTIYNNALDMFPSNLFAAMLNFKPEALFEATNDERQNVDVKKLFASK
ncbi:MAG TPA: LemA family protein [Oligoflexia bacterium]|nr:LemA family protein [Oligoflexia bacterium]